MDSERCERIAIGFSILGWLDKMLGVMRKGKTIGTEAELRTALQQIHADTPQKLIDDAIEYVKKRIDMLFEKEGGHIEVRVKRK